MKSEGIIIRTYPSRDADLVLRVISRDYGKISLLAKHARRSKKRFGSSFDLFDCGEFELSTGKGSLFLVRGFSPRVAFRSLREDLDKFITGSLICECFDLIVKEGSDAGSAATFELLQLSLVALHEADSLREVLRSTFFAVGNLLDQSGFLDRSGIEEPSANNLQRLLYQLELSAERELKGKAPVIELIERLRNQAAKTDSEVIAK